MTAIVVLGVATALALRAAMGASTTRVPSADAHPTRQAAMMRRLRARLARLVGERGAERALPEVLDAVARSLRSGASLRLAVAEAAVGTPGVVGDELRGVVAELDHGGSLAGALGRWAEVRPVPGVRLATAALVLGAETGGGSAQAIDGVAATLRTNLAIAGEVRALSSQARLSALVIVLAPIGFALLAASSDPATATFLLRTPFGLVCLAGGLGLDAVGWLWMRRIVAAVT